MGKIIQFIFIFIILAYSQKLSAKMDSCKIDKCDFFTTAIQAAVDSALRNGTQDNHYEVFVVRFYHLLKDSSDFSFTISVIENSFEYKLFDPKYYYKFGNQYIIIGRIDIATEKTLNSIGIKKINHYDLNSQAPIVQKLFPESIGFLSYSPFDMACKVSNCESERIFYEHSSLTPVKKSILGKELDGQTKDVTHEYR